MATTIKSGQTITLTDSSVHEYQFNSGNNKAIQARFRNQEAVTLRCTIKAGSLSYSIGVDDPDANSNSFVAGDSFVCDIVNGVSNLKIKASVNPTTFYVEI